MKGMSQVVLSISLLIVASCGGSSGESKDKAKGTVFERQLHEDPTLVENLDTQLRTVKLT